jgi:hypothetical protein
LLDRVGFVCSQYRVNPVGRAKIGVACVDVIVSVTMTAAYSVHHLVVRHDAPATVEVSKLHAAFPDRCPARSHITAIGEASR